MIRYEQPAHVTANRLTLNDLHGLKRLYDGEIEPLPTGGHILRGALIDGRRVDLGPVPGPVRVEVAS